jgi:hypothetical protein
MAGEPLFDFLQKPIAVNWPGKRVLVLEASGQFSQQVEGTADVTPDPPQPVLLGNLGPQVSSPTSGSSKGFNILGAAFSAPNQPPLTVPTPNPITPKMFTTYYTWMGGATISVVSIIGTLTEVRSVTFLNLDLLRSQFDSKDPMFNKYQFTLNTAACPPTDPNGHITIWAVKWNTQCATFGWLPGNGFAPLVFSAGGQLTNDQALTAGKDTQQPDPNPLHQTQAQRVIADEGPNCPPSFAIDFLITEPAFIDHIVFYDFRASTYKGKTDFPVVAGSAGWDVFNDPDLQNTPCEVTLFGDSGGATKLGARKILWQVDFTDDLAVAASLTPVS